MSDGPHRSLPLRPAWKRVAHWADRQAFAVEEVQVALLVAVEQDCRQELRPGFLAHLRRIVEEPSLFENAIAAKLDALRPQAGPGFERAVLERFSFLSESDADGFEQLRSAICDAAQDGAMRRARQVEEHFLRRTSTPRARDVRGRVEAAAGDASAFRAVANRLMGVDPRHPPTTPPKYAGLDDGVKV